MGAERLDQRLTLENFASCVGRTFRLDAEPEAIDMTLTEAAAVGAPPADGSMRQAFSLVFTGPPGCVLPQQTYQLIHQEMGELDIFLVPIGSDEEGTQYEAIFN